MAAVVVRRSGITPGAVLRAFPPQAHALAVLAFVVDLLARGARVACVARGLGLRVSLATSVRAQLAGDALGAVTPSRVGADPAKLTVLRSGGVGIGAAGALLLAEMASEAFMLLVLAVVVVAVVPGMWWVAVGVGGYALVVSAAGLCAMWLSRATGLASAPPRLWGWLRLSERRWSDLCRPARSFTEHARELVRLPAGAVAGALAAAVVHLSARLTILPALLIPAGAVGLGFADLVLRPFFLLYATALLPPPGGGGGVELAFAATLSPALSGARLAAALIWWRIYTFYLSALVGWLYLGVASLAPHKILDTGS